MRANSKAKKPMSVFGVRHCLGMAWYHDGTLMMAVEGFPVRSRAWVSDHTLFSDVVRRTAAISCGIVVKVLTAERRQAKVRRETEVCRTPLLRPALHGSLELLGRAPIVNWYCRITAELHES